MPIERLDGKFKLGQNRSAEAIRDGIAKRGFKGAQRLVDDFCKPLLIVDDRRDSNRVHDGIVPRRHRRPFHIPRGRDVGVGTMKPAGRPSLAIEIAPVRIRTRQVSDDLSGFAPFGHDRAGR